MNVRWVIPALAAFVSLSTVAAAQTAPAPVVKAVVVPVVDQAPPAPPAPPVPPAAVTAPQAPGPLPAPRAPQAPRATRPVAPDAPAPDEVRHSRGQPVNLRLEFTVTDQIGAAPPVRKTITMNVADGESGRIRTNAEVHRKNAAMTVVPLSVDAYPAIEGGKIRLRASLEYQLLKDEPEPGVPAGKTSITQSVTSILTDGVAAILSQSADPLTDRKVTLEVKATIIK